MPSTREKKFYLINDSDSGENLFVDDCELLTRIAVLKSELEEVCNQRLEMDVVTEDGGWLINPMTKEYFIITSSGVEFHEAIAGMVKFGRLVASNTRRNIVRKLFEPTELKEGDRNDSHN